MRRSAKRGLGSKAAIRLLCVLGLLISMLNVAGPAHATFPGKNGLLAFEGLQDGSHSEIFVVRADGSHLRQLTHEPSGSLAFLPRFSPDGRRIAYCVASEFCEAADGSRDSRIWVMNRDGSDQHQVTDDPAYFDVNPSWSPDGHHIIFSRCSTFFLTCDIDVMRADGSHIRKLIAGHWHHSAPAYSPDGTLVSFASDKGGYNSRVWVAQADGSDPRPVTPPALFGYGSDWAPDGSRILFDAELDTPNIWTVAPDGSALRRFARFPSFEAAYSPNGRKILASDLDLPGCGCSGLVLVNRDGTIQNRVITSKRVPNIGAGFDWGVAP